jgi:hypothetical protein
LVRFPTRIDAHTKTANILDLIFSTHSRQITNLTVGDKFSDHAIISFDILAYPCCSEINKPYKKYLYNKGDYQAIRDELKSIIGVFLESSDAESRSVESIWQFFKSRLMTLIDKHIPSKIVTNKYKPTWLNNKVKKLIKKRDKLAKKSLSSGLPHDRQMFQTIRSTVKREVALAQRQHLTNIIGNIKEAPSRFYKYINSKRTDGSQIPPLTDINGSALLNNKDKAEALCSQFSSVFTLEDVNNMPKFDVKTPSMKDIKVTIPGVFKLLSEIIPNKATGPDELPPRLLKECANEIAPIITLLFNQSLLSGVIPQDWKIANVCPIFKKGNKSTLENYRPVSLTSVLSKVLEHIIYSNISKHLEQFNILSPRQHGFRSGHSCESQLILALNDWAKVIDAKGQSDIAILDFSKAFDTVPHKRLMLKLQGYGIQGTTLSWIIAFLSDRRQRVAIDGSFSGWSPVTSGVPQGTVLGPLLFLLFINDIGNNIASDIRLFADDCVLYRKIDSQSDCDILQHDLDTLTDWADKWQMRFNTKKCHIMHMTKRRKPINNAYNMAGTPLAVVKSHPYLGVDIQCDLRWDDHVNSVVNKASKILGMLRRNVSCCTRSTKATAFLSLVRPLLEYASPVWDPYRTKHIDALEMVQRRGARFVMSDYRYTSSVTTMLSDLKWPSLADRRKISRLVVFYKAVNNLVAIPLDSLTRRSRPTRSNPDHAISYINLHANCDILKYSFFPKTIVDWNSLSTSTRGTPTINAFRSATAAELHSR